MAQALPHKNNKNDGSPDQGEPLFLIIGKIRRPHGVRGEMLFEIITEFPERVKKGLEVYVGDHKKAYRIESVRTQQQHFLLKFKDLDDCDQVGLLRNQLVYKKAENLPPLTENEYYQHDLLGMQVVTEEGIELGSVAEILETGANDVLVVLNEEKELLIPFITQTILKIKDQERIIVVRLQEWN